MANSRFRNQTLRYLIETTKGRSYTVTVVTAILVLVLFLAAIFPAVSSIFTQLNENKERQLALRQIDNKRQTIGDLVSAEETDRAVSYALSDALPDTLNQSGVVKTVLDLTVKHGLTLANLRFATLDSTRSNFDEFELDTQALDGNLINISVEGDRNRMEGFLGDLEASRRIFNVRSVSISRREQAGGGSGVPFRLNIQAEVYFWNIAKLEE